MRVGRGGVFGGNVGIYFILDVIRFFRCDFKFRKNLSSVFWLNFIRMYKIFYYIV